MLVIMPYDDEEDALGIANDSDTGSPAACTRPPRSAPRRSPAASVPARSRSTAPAFNPLAPFGGYKQSGNGRELGPYGIEEFLVLKSLQL